MSTKEIKVGRQVVILGGEYIGCRAWVKPNRNQVASKAQKVTLIIEIKDEDDETDLHIALISRTHFKFVEELSKYEQFMLQNPSVVKAMRDAARKVAESGLVSNNCSGIGKMFEEMVQEKLRHKKGLFTPIDRMPQPKKRGTKHKAEDAVEID